MTESDLSFLECGGVIDTNSSSRDRLLLDFTYINITIILADIVMVVEC